MDTSTGTSTSTPLRSASETGSLVIGLRVWTATLLLLVVSVTLNVILARRVHSSNHIQSVRASELLLKVGVVVPPILATRLGGKQEVIAYQGTNQSTILYIFTPPCSWCARNMDNLKTLLEKEGGQYRFLGLSLSGQNLPEYVAKNGLKLPVYSGLSLETLKTYKLGSTPQTIVISEEGKVLQDWTGAYVGDQKTQIEKFFHISLPGLKELPKAEAAKN